MTTLDLSDKELGPAEAHVLAGLLPVSHSLTAADLQFNGLNDDAKQLVRESVKGHVGFDLKL